MQTIKLCDFRPLNRLFTCFCNSKIRNSIRNRLSTLRFYALISILNYFSFKDTIFPNSTYDQESDVSRQGRSELKGDGLVN